MNTKIDVHKNNQVGKKLEGVQNWKVPDSSKKEIKTFIEKGRIGQVQEGKRLSERTLSKYLSLLKRVLESINKQTGKINKSDIEKFDRLLTKENLKSSVDYRRVLLIFLKWKLGESKSKKLAGWLDTRDKTKTPDYLSEKEVERLFKDCKNSTERFLIAVLFDSGARIEEFLNIRFEDIQEPSQGQNYYRVMLKEEYSKTLGRNISLYWRYSLNAVRDFLEERKAEGIKSNEPIFNKTYDAIRFLLNRLSKRVLKKQVSPHLFRHSSATYYATKLNRQELCYRFGWKFSSDMPDVYISRSGMENKELDEKFKATELEILKNEFEKERFNNQKRLEELEKRIESMDKFFNSIGYAEFIQK